MSSNYALYTDVAVYNLVLVNFHMISSGVPSIGELSLGYGKNGRCNVLHLGPLQPWRVPKVGDVAIPESDGGSRIEKNPCPPRMVISDP